MRQLVAGFRFQCQHSPRVRLGRSFLRIRLRSTTLIFSKFQRFQSSDSLSFQFSFGSGTVFFVGEVIHSKQSYVCNVRKGAETGIFHFVHISNVQQA